MLLFREEKHKTMIFSLEKKKKEKQNKKKNEQNNEPTDAGSQLHPNMVILGDNYKKCTV